MSPPIHPNKPAGQTFWQVQEVDEHWEFDSLLQRVAIEMQEESEKIQRAMNEDNVKDDDFWSGVLYFIEYACNIVNRCRHYMFEFN